MKTHPEQIYLEPSSFCPRHRGNPVVRRCYHIGSRYVSEMRLHNENPPSGFIDYVQDDSDATRFKVIDECYFSTADEAEIAWTRMVERMKEDGGTDR